MLCESLITGCDSCVCCSRCTKIGTDQQAALLPAMAAKEAELARLIVSETQA